jgi:hypothetical protein
VRAITSQSVIALNSGFTVSRSALAVPADVDLPFFSYGAFKPGELAFSQIAPFLSARPESASVSGSLKVRDGLPLLDSSGGRRVQGFMLAFTKEKRLQAYETICRFEPKTIYLWKETELLSPAVRVNLLVGRKLDRGRAQELEGESWSFRDDPVFTHGMRVVEAATQEWGQHPFDSAPPDHFDWARFFRLQMSYLLLWSIIERYSAFAFGPALSPEAKIKALGGDPGFISALRRHAPAEARNVSDSRDPGERVLLDAADPAKAATYFYQVRSNLSHRGKGAWTDGEIVRQSLVALLTIFKDMLSLTKQ